MAYVNPLHSQVGNVSSYSTLSGAVSGGSHVFTSPFRRWLPQPDYSPVSKWRAATATDNRHLPAVFFDFIGHSKQGVNMREISVRGAAGLGQMLVGANDSVFTSTGLQRITLRIMWPGYTHVDWSRNIDLVVQGPITRAQLAFVLVQNFARFIERARPERPNSPAFAIGPTGIQFEHLVLVGLHNVFEDVWQADVAVDRR